MVRKEILVCNNRGIETRARSSMLCSPFSLFQAALDPRSANFHSLRSFVSIRGAFLIARTVDTEGVFHPSRYS